MNTFASLKATALKVVREVHRPFARSYLPDDLAIYFHELGREQLPAFDELLAYFADQGYRTVEPGAFARSASGKRLFVSFDDNFCGWHRALDLMERRRARCTFYVNSGPLRDRASKADIAAYFERICYGGPDTTLSGTEVREIHAAGHTIGCHTHSHPVLSRLSQEHWDDEIRRSRDLLEELTGKPVRHFSFPFGMRRHFSPQLRDYCKGLGFETIATGISGLQYLDNTSTTYLHRTGWNLGLPLKDNLDNLKLHAPLYAGLAGRSVVGATSWLTLPVSI